MLVKSTAWLVYDLHILLFQISKISQHPHYAFDSPARANDMDLATTNAYAGPNHLTANIQHGSWTMPLKPGKAPEVNFLNSNQQVLYEDLKYEKEDIEAVEEWVKRHVETTWHSLGVRPSLQNLPSSSLTVGC